MMTSRWVRPLIFLAIALGSPSAGPAFAGMDAAEEEKPAAESREERERKAWKVAQSLPGYEELRERFDIEDVVLGSVNRFDPALFVRLRTASAEGFNVAWWWSPLVDIEPSLGWNDFLACFDEADRAVREHPWLQEWRTAGPGRTLELHAFGCEPSGDDFEMDHFVNPLWSDAGLEGNPVYEILARRSDHSWITLYLGPTGGPALVQSTMSPEKNGAHWLDRLAVRFHPRCKDIPENARYFTVSPSGEVTERTFASCEP